LSAPYKVRISGGVVALDPLAPEQGWANVDAFKGDVHAIARLAEAAPVLLSLLEELSKRLDDEADINWNGGPNLAMRLRSELGNRIDAALATARAA
jgi:hypothetical protein